MATLSNSSSSSSLFDSNKTVCSSGNNVYEMCGLISGLPLHIECITGYDDFIIVGSKEGHLLIYKITFRNQSKLHADIEITLSNKNFTTAIGTTATKKAVTQLDVIPEHRILVALTSEGISTHDLSMYHCKCISSIERTKGASIFTLNIQRQTSLTGDPSLTVRLCVAVGRSLQFYYWKNRSFFQLREDFAIPDTPRALSWCQEVILLGFKNEYCQLDLLSGKQQDVCCRSKQGEPIITPVSRDEYGVVNDKQCFLFQVSKSESKKVVVVAEDKNVKEKNAVITWTDNPISLVYDEPYFIGILSGLGVEVRTYKPKLKIDLFPIPQANLACSPKSGFIFVASNDSLWCLKSTPVVTQMDLFVKQNHFELALGLANIWKEVASEKQKKIIQIKNLFAFHLFCKKKFKEAMTIFMELGTDASHVIGLFPGLLPQEFRLQIDYPGPVSELRGADFEGAMANLIMFLTNSRTVLLGNSSQTITESASGIVEGATIIKSKKQLLQIIDTTLLKCYLESKESLVASLLRLKDNHCHVEETERALIKHKKFNELIILYQTKGNHRKALETLLKQQDIDRVVEYLQRLGREEMDLILEFAKYVFEESPEKGLKIFTEDLQEVDQLSRPRVYDFISKSFPDYKSHYLEHVINFWDEKNSLFHNALVNEYRDQYMSEEEQSKKDIVREKLRKFLKKSHNYSPEIVLVHFPYECMFEERAMVLERMGRHDQVLAIYVTILKEPAMAMEYCKTIFDKTDPSKREVFTILMKMFLSGPTLISLPGLSLDFPQHVPDISSVMILLKDYAPYIDPIQVLGDLPDEVQLTDIQRFLMTSVQNRLSEKRKYLIQKGLIKAEFLRASNEKVMVESERFYIDESTPCALCNKKIANQNAFVRCPDGSILHYHCHPGQMPSEDPVMDQ